MLFYQWDLVCDRNVLPEASQMVFNFGVMFGAILFGFLSDKFGRKKTFISALVIQAVIGCVTAASPNFYVFTALRFLVGALEQVRAICQSSAAAAACGRARPSWNALNSITETRTAQTDPSRWSSILIISHVPISRIWALAVLKCSYPASARLGVVLMTSFMTYDLAFYLS